MGILHSPLNVGALPDCIDLAECGPDEIVCNAAPFKNDPGVEDQKITGDEMAKHIEKEHVVAFDTFEQLSVFVEGKPILNKMGLVIKTRNGVTKARMILDTKQSGVKRINSECRAGYITTAIRRYPMPPMPFGEGDLYRYNGRCFRT